MSIHHPFGRQLRLGDLSRVKDERFFIVPLDHFITVGPTEAVADLGSLALDLAGAGVDAVVLHKGSVKRMPVQAFHEMSLIVHLSASTIHAHDPDAKYLVATVEEAIRDGASAVSVHVNLGSETERAQISDLAAVADACRLWNMPLLAMVYPRGPKITSPNDPALVAHAAQLAGDLGADIVKVPRCVSDEDMLDVVAASPIPLVTAGGPAVESEADLIADVMSTMGCGAAGVAIGRNVFEARDPAQRASAIRAAVHRTEAITNQSQPALASA